MKTIYISEHSPQTVEAEYVNLGAVGRNISELSRQAGKYIHTYCEQTMALF